MNALIIANGPQPSRTVLLELASASGLIVCADGGANYAMKARLIPDIIVGDLDSITPSTRRHYSRVPTLHVRDQESTDLEKAITFCIQCRVASADITGALGERIDHATGSLGCFKKFGRKIELRFHDTFGVLTLIRENVTVNTGKGQKLSLIPLEKCLGITTRNLKYELKNEPLELGVREGISNEAKSSEVRISVRKGTLLLYRIS